MCDWVHVDNLVHAMALAAAAIRAPKGATDSSGPVGQDAAGGKAFAVSDGSPVNNFEFLGQLLGCEKNEIFWFYAPTWLMQWMGRACEVLHAALSWIVPFEPFLTRTEVRPTPLLPLTTRLSTLPAHCFFLCQ